MQKKQMMQITEETYHFLNNKGVDFICYIWEKDGEFAGGCQSASADMFDAMVTIERIIKHFNIDPEALRIALTEAKLEMERS